MISRNKPILITGVAGFIGSFLAKKLIEENYFVVGIDNLNDYYDISLKEKRLEFVKEAAKDKNNFSFHKISIEKDKELDFIFKKYDPSIVVHLAAQAGVRYSIENPSSYIQSNLVGFSNILECSRKVNSEHLIYASSSSVYGGNRLLPYSENHSVNHPISLYAATKKSNELLAHAYSHLYKIPTTGLRFFTVYGPYGRPDMAPMIFAKAILSSKPIDVYNFGKMSRDFTYIDDVVNAIKDCCFKKAFVDKNFDQKSPNPSSSFAPFRIFNVGNSRPVELMDFVRLLEKYLGKKACIQYKPIQKGDVISTYADMTNIKEWINFESSTSIEKGLKEFCEWISLYHKSNA
ncbi:GDP-mannose 4,6-dehydratase [Prochlorococcus sp. MIT 0604]|uniref:GDP-mannose 4,6-dehydratase n=1 Tax=Prochlorococcus sp. MIT 0604 TaxID=1501268 RepID=UPI0004F6D2C2|nr:GDP-mannose 4,6-dehydratase [Prochlorococcus sp. MIT 0604]AIQ95459.1 Putative nucleotide sugar epimerase [Prochlorococcus sp. MIT 0604]